MYQDRLGTNIGKTQKDTRFLAGTVEAAAFLTRGVYHASHAMLCAPRSPLRCLCTRHWATGYVTHAPMRVDAFNSSPA
jgi:hypothetical protein